MHASGSVSARGGGSKRRAVEDALNAALLGKFGDNPHAEAVVLHEVRAFVSAGGRMSSASIKHLQQKVHDQVSRMRTKPLALGLPGEGISSALRSPRIHSARGNQHTGAFGRNSPRAAAALASGTLRLAGSRTMAGGGRMSPRAGGMQQSIRSHASTRHRAPAQMGQSGALSARGPISKDRVRAAGIPAGPDSMLRSGGGGRLRPALTAMGGVPPDDGSARSHVARMRATGRMDAAAGAESPRRQRSPRGARGGAGHRELERSVRIAEPSYSNEEYMDYVVRGAEPDAEPDLEPAAARDPVAERSERVRHRVMADPTPDRVDEVIEEVLQKREKDEERRTRLAEQKQFRADLRKQEEEKARREVAEKEEEVAFMEMMQARDKAETEMEAKEQERVREQDRTQKQARRRQADRQTERRQQETDERIAWERYVQALGHQKDAEDKSKERKGVMENRAKMRTLMDENDMAQAQRKSEERARREHERDQMLHDTEALAKEDHDRKALMQQRYGKPADMVLAAKLRREARKEEEEKEKERYRKEFQSMKDRVETAERLDRAKKLQAQKEERAALLEQAADKRSQARAQKENEMKIADLLKQRSHAEQLEVKEEEEAMAAKRRLYQRQLDRQRDLQQRLADRKRKKELEAIADRLKAVEGDDELMDAIDGALLKRAEERDVAMHRGDAAKSGDAALLRKAAAEAEEAALRAEHESRW